MLLEIGLIVAGVPVGFLLRNSQPVLKVMSKVNTWSVLLLLFFLGLSLGSDSTLMAQIQTLGLRALCISVLSVTGCVLGIVFIRPSLEKSMEKNKAPQ